jgi:hypothetical protein
MVLGVLQVEGLALAQVVPSAQHEFPRDSARSTPALDLKVDRDASTSDCPDTQQLRRALFSQAVTLPKEPLALRVQFARKEAQFVVIIRASGALRGTRMLQIPADNCVALIEPVAVALAILIDSHASDARAEESSPLLPTPSTRVTEQQGLEAKAPTDTKETPERSVRISAHRERSNRGMVNTEIGAS